MAASVVQKPELTAALVSQLCSEAAARHAQDTELIEIENELRRDLCGVELSWDRSIKYGKQPYTAGGSVFLPPPTKRPATEPRPSPFSTIAPASADTKEPKAAAPPPPPPPPPAPQPDTAAEADEESLGPLIFQGGTEMEGELHLVSIHEVPNSGLYFISCIDLDKNEELTLKISQEEIVTASGSQIGEGGAPSTAQWQAVLKQLRLNAGVLSLEAASEKDESELQEEPATIVAKARGSCIDMLNPSDLGGGGDDVPGLPGSADTESEEVRDKVLSKFLGLAESGRLEEALGRSLGNGTETSP